MLNNIFRSSEVNQSLEPEPADSSGKGSAAFGIQQGRAASQNEMQSVTNPLRSLGDALKEIRQRFDEILKPSDDNPAEVSQEPLRDPNTQSQVEYLRPDDIDNDMQAMGPAGDEQVAKLNQLTIIDDETPVDESHMPMDVDTPLALENPEDGARQPEGQQDKASGSERGEDIEGAFLQTGSRPTDDVGAEFGSELPKADEIKEQEDHSVELQLKEWVSAQLKLICSSSPAYLQFIHICTGDYPAASLSLSCSTLSITVERKSTSYEYPGTQNEKKVLSLRSLFLSAFLGTSAECPPKHFCWRHFI